MRRFHREFGLKKARILRERLIPVSKGLKIGINRHPLYRRPTPYTSAAAGFLLIFSRSPFEKDMI